MEDGQSASRPWPFQSSLNLGDEALGTGEELCPECKGGGRVKDGACPVCGGTGRVIEGIGGA